jgi:hypothetical protein
MAFLEVGGRKVVISVKENFLWVEVSSDPEDKNAFNKIIEQVIDEFAAVIESMAEQFPDTNI